MDVIFLKLYHMSITAGWLILAVIVLRLLLRKAPKWISCILWAIVAVRLVCPFSLESSFSLIPSTETIPSSVIWLAEEPSHGSVDSFVNSDPQSAMSKPLALDSQTLENEDAKPQSGMFAAGIVWVIGMVLMLGYAFASFLRIHAKVKESVPLRDNIWLCDAVQSPFVLGIFRPRIYLSSGIAEEQMKYVLAHEQAHLRRRDHWWKPFGYLLLAVYWFHPLVWVAYILLCRDIELACDEKVIKNMSLDEKKAYSGTLVACTMQRKMIMACPLAFGEVGVKERVKTILNYRKSTFWIMITALAACVIVAVCFLTNPKEETADVRNFIQANITDAFYNFEKFFPVNNKSQLSEGDGIDNTSAVLNPAEEKNADQAIIRAIMEHNVSAHREEFDFSCCDFITLDTESQLNESGNETITYYGWELYLEFKIYKNKIEEGGGGHIPVALTFEVDEEGYHLKEYWVPGDGSFYISDIRDKFPAHISEDGIDSQKYILQQMQSCYKQAIQYGEVDTDAAISSLLDAICADPKVSSNPKDYIDVHPIEYRELTYYGEYTLRYCFHRFGKGNETGLDGKIMAMVCEEILQTKGHIPLDADEADTGQIWFETLCAHGGNKVMPYFNLNEIGP